MAGNTNLRYCQHGSTIDHDYEGSTGQVLVCIADTFFWDLDTEVQDKLRAELAPVIHCTCCHNSFVHADEHTWHFTETGGTEGFGMCRKCNYGLCFCDEWDLVGDGECEIRNMRKQCREAKS